MGTYFSKKTNTSRHTGTGEVILKLDETSLKSNKEKTNQEKPNQEKPNQEKPNQEIRNDETERPQLKTPNPDLVNIPDLGHNTDLDNNPKKPLLDLSKPLEIETYDPKTIIQRMKECGKYFQPYGYGFYDVQWDDCSRSSNSCLGENISDWTLVCEDGTICPVIRSSNFKDKTLTIKAKDISLIVGNHQYNGDLTAVTFQHFLEYFGEYTNGVPEETDLSLTDEDLVTIRFVAVIVPEKPDGNIEVVPTAYNYNTEDKKNPKNFIGASFHLGMGVRTDGTGMEKVFLVKNKPNGEDENMWFKITREEKETEEQKSVSSSVLGTRSTGCGRNRVQCFQIPRKQDYSGPRSRGCGGIVARGSGSSCPVPVSVGNVSYGKSAGSHQIPELKSYEREPDSYPTITFAYYYTTRDGRLTKETAKHIVDTLEKDYQDTKGLWTGSLVTGEEIKQEGTNNSPPIKLKEPSQTDMDDFANKITNHPKDLGDIQTFPS